MSDHSHSEFSEGAAETTKPAYKKFLSQINNHKLYFAGAALLIGADFRYPAAAVLIPLYIGIKLCPPVIKTWWKEKSRDNAHAMGAVMFVTFVPPILLAQTYMWAHDKNIAYSNAKEVVRTQLLEGHKANANIIQPYPQYSLFGWDSKPGSTRIFGRKVEASSAEAKADTDFKWFSIVYSDGSTEDYKQPIAPPSGYKNVQLEEGMLSNVEGRYFTVTDSEGRLHYYHLKPPSPPKGFEGPSVQELTINGKLQNH